MTGHRTVGTEELRIAVEDTWRNIPPAVIREIVSALRSIRFGSLEIVIHDGKVMQVERRERVRFGVEGAGKHR